MPWTSMSILGIFDTLLPSLSSQELSSIPRSLNLNILLQIYLNNSINSFFSKKTFLLKFA